MRSPRSFNPKSALERPLVSPVSFDPPSNGEFCPRPQSPRANRMERLFWRAVEDLHRRLGMTRRQFAESACGMASALWAINQAACGDDGGSGAGYGVSDEMMQDEELARQVLSGDDFIFDVQTHVSDPLEAFERDDPPQRALDFIKEIFVQSETSVACVTGVPATRDLGIGNVEASRTLREIIDRLAGPRLIFHVNADPENGPGELDYMSSVVDQGFTVAAWKVYPHDGALRLDSEELGGPFVERALSLRVPVIAAHRGISGGGGLDAAGSPRDVVRAAKAAPDVKFLIYHSGWESGFDENHPYDPANTNPQGVDRLIRALEENQLGPGGNVYAELGTTWFNLMTEPDQAAHVLGKLLLYLGPERIVWGTDCVFNGVPQSQITALRMFQIPESLQSEFGYPALTAETRARIFGLNAADVYGVDPAAVRYSIADDEVDRLRSAFLQDPRSVPLPDQRIYEGPRTRREFMALLAREKHARMAARAARG